MFIFRRKILKIVIKIKNKKYQEIIKDIIRGILLLINDILLFENLKYIVKVASSRNTKSNFV